MQRRDEVVVLLSVLVVGQAAALQGGGEARGVERLSQPEGVEALRQRQHEAAVAVGHDQQRLARGGRQRQRAALQRFGAGQELGQGGVVQPAQHEHLAAGQQGAVEFEAGVLRGGAHQRDVAALDIRQEAVLLGAVEAVDLVDEQQRRLPGATARARRLERLAQLGHAREDRRQLLELVARGGGEQARDGRLADAPAAPTGSATTAAPPPPSGRWARRSRAGAPARPPRRASSAASARRAGAARRAPAPRLRTGRTRARV